MERFTHKVNIKAYKKQKGKSFVLEMTSPFVW